MNCHEASAKVKANAQHAVHLAIKEGRLLRPKTCSVCGGRAPLAHHEDYTKPLDVIWLCKRCHYDRHIVLSAEHRERYGKEVQEPSAESSTVTCEQAAAMHNVTPIKIARMCLKGQGLAKKYKGASKVPEKEKKTAIFANKVGKAWAVPVTELERVFLP